MKPGKQMECGIFQNSLCTRRDVPVLLHELFAFGPRWTKRALQLFTELLVLREMVVQHTNVEFKIVVAIY